MSKKKTDIKSYLTYLPIITIAAGLVGSWVRFSVQAEDTKNKVNRLEADAKIEIDKIKTEIKEITEEGDEEIKELKADNKELETAVKVNKTQQDNIQAQVQQISEKTDKIYEVLLDLSKKKK